MTEFIAGLGELFHPKTIFRHFIRPPIAKNLRIDGKRVLITGGNKGIGLGAVLEIAKHNPESITICARSKESLKDRVAIRASVPSVPRIPFVPFRSVLSK